MKQLLNIIFQISWMRRKLIHSIALDNIGVDASPNDEAPDELGCAESVTEILKKAGTFPYIEISTYRLENALNASPNWYEVEDPQPGDVVISPTGRSSKAPAPFPGHTGIVGNNNTIMSNDSRTGKFMSNYTFDTWKGRWVKRGGYKMMFYRYEYGVLN